MPDAPIDLQTVRKVYPGRIHALRDVSMRVHKGEIFGLLGPNGAGKSTLVKILMTVVRPTRCGGTLLGRPVGDKGALARVGYLPEHHKFPDYLTGTQVLDFYSALASIAAPVRRRRAGELLDRVGLARWQHKRVSGYSKGMRQRLGIAQALMNDPDLILLDEPTDGVDPVGRRDIRAILLEQKRLGKTVFLNSHLLSELELVCDRVAIMVQGAVTSQGTLADLTGYGCRYEIEAVAPRGAEADAPGLVLAAAAKVANLAEQSALPNRAWEPPSPLQPVRVGTLRDGVPVEINRTLLRVGTDDPEPVQPLLDALRHAGLMIRVARPVRPTLEDLFMRAVTDPVTGRSLAPGAGEEPRP